MLHCYTPCGNNFLQDPTFQLDLSLDHCAQLYSHMVSTFGCQFFTYFCSYHFQVHTSFLADKTIVKWMERPTLVNESLVHGIIHIFSKRWKWSVELTQFSFGQKYWFILRDIYSLINTFSNFTFFVFPFWFLGGYLIKPHQPL